MHLLQRLQASICSRLNLPLPIVETDLLGHKLLLRYGTVRARPDYDDAWVWACTSRAQVVFDIGANIGYDALLAVISGHPLQIVLVEANFAALKVAAENLIRNRMSNKVRFVVAFVAETADETVRFFTVGTGAAGSIYAQHAQTASKKGSSLLVSTTTIDEICSDYNLVPDFVKIDVEGAEVQVLQGSNQCIQHRKTRFLVEMHSNPDLPMSVNAQNLLSWCSRSLYTAWYLKDKSLLVDSEQVAHRGRCHLLLQPQEWPFPDWLLPIAESDAVPMNRQEL